jgi:hypothetical protein
MSGELGKALAQKVTREMTSEQLEKHLANTLKKVKMCTLVTSKSDIPRGTPIEYFSDGLTLYLSPDSGTKTDNLKVNPNVGVTIYNSVTPDWENDWQTILGIQITGKGEVFEEGDQDHTYGLKMIHFEGFFRALGMKETELPKGRKILKVTPSKIELLEYGLIAKGFAHRQVWQVKG